MIKPVEKFSEEKRSILHIIYRLQTTLPGKDYIDDIVHNGNAGPSTGRVPESNAIGKFTNDLLVTIIMQIGCDSCNVRSYP